MTLLKLNEKGRLCLKSSNGIEEIKPALNVLLLLDTSGSMAGDKIVQAKGGATDFARSAGQHGYRTALAVFGDRAAMVCDPAPGSSILEKKISGLTACIVGAGTNLAAGLDLAGKFQQLYAVVVVTDGQPDSQPDALSAAEALKRRGIEIFCIGTDDADRAFLEKLATRTGFALHVEAKQLRTSIGEASHLLIGAGN